MLEVESLTTGYGDKEVLHDVTVHVKSGEIVALLGPNGSGKTTLLRAISGVVHAWKGRVLFEDIELGAITPDQAYLRGIAFCPQANRVFKEMSVLDNLRLGGIRLPPRMLSQRIEEVCNSLSSLKPLLSKRAWQLSLGQQQILALGRTLVGNSKLLLLDEPSLGLAPDISKEIFDLVSDLSRTKQTGVLVVEHQVDLVSKCADRVYGLRLGRIVLKDVKPSSLSHEALRRVYLT